MGSYNNQGHRRAVTEQSQCMDDLPKPWGKGNLRTKDNKLIQELSGKQTEAEPGFI